MDMNLSKLGRQWRSEEAWCSAAHRVPRVRHNTAALKNNKPRLRLVRKVTTSLGTDEHVWPAAKPNPRKIHREKSRNNN